MRASWCGVALLAACGGGASTAPDAPTGAFCTDQMPRAPTFANVQLVFTGCAVCHSAVVPLDLQPDVAYGNLINKPPPSYADPMVDESCGLVLVRPGDPAGSYLYQKLSSATPCAGSQMPLSEFGVSQALPACEQLLIHDWIAAGAPP